MSIFVKQTTIFFLCSVKLTVEKDMDGVRVKFQANNSKLIVIKIYRSPNRLMEVFFSNLEHLLT